MTEPQPRQRLRAFWHRVVRRYRSEICDACGRPVMRCTGSWWHADDALWLEVVRPTHISRGNFRAIGSGTLCPPCFTEATEAKGIHIFWHARVEYRDGQDVEQGQRLAGLRA